MSNLVKFTGVLEEPWLTFGLLRSMQYVHSKSQYHASTRLHAVTFRKLLLFRDRRLCSLLRKTKQKKICIITT
jgi:hypothetical protein